MRAVEIKEVGLYFRSRDDGKKEYVGKQEICMQVDVGGLFRGLLEGEYIVGQMEGG